MKKDVIHLFSLKTNKNNDIIQIGDKMKIICLGHATYDVTYPLDEFPIENTKNRVQERIECGGGPASTAAYLLGSWGEDVYFAGVVGDDYYGHKIKEEFERVNVHTDYLELRQDHDTTSSIVLANRANGSRTTFAYKPKAVSMNSFELDFEPDVILIDGQEYERSLELLKKYPNAITIIDAGRDRKEVIELSKLVKWLVCSKDFAENVTGIKIDYNQPETITMVYKKLKDIFQNEIVVTLEDKGCFYNNEIIPSIKLKSIDSTGAGDIFHGAFTYYLAKGYDAVNVLKLANYAGAISVSRIGTRNSIPTKEEMEAVYNEFK